jgi:hypothetical protein
MAAGRGETPVFAPLSGAAAPIDKGGTHSYVSTASQAPARGACGCEKTRKRRFSVHLDRELDKWRPDLRCGGVPGARRGRARSRARLAAAPEFSRGTMTGQGCRELKGSPA